MALKLLTAIGQTDGVDVTVANSDDFGDNALTAVTLGTGSTIKYSTEQATPAANLVSLKVFGPSGQQSVVQQGGGLAQLYLTGSYFFYFTDRPPVGGRTKLIQMRSSTTTGGVTIDSDGFLRCENTTGTTIYTGAVQVPLNQWIRIDYAEVADTTTTGTTHFAWFNNPTSNTVVESFDATNVNHLTTNITIVNIGKVTASTWATPFYIATLRTQDATGLLGPFGAEKTASGADSIGITGSVSTASAGVVVVTDTIGITDTGGSQTLDVSLSMTDTVGIVDGSETLDSAGLLARWVADDLVQGGAADGDLVTAWSEWSDQVPDALAQPTAASQPTLRAAVAGLNGHAAVEFDGVGNFLSLNGAALALAQNVPGLAVFVVYQLFGTDVAGGPCDLFALSSGTSAAQHRAALYSHSASLLPQVAGRRLDINSLQSINGQAILTGHAGIMYGRWQYATAYAELYQDAALTASVTPFQTAGNTSNTASLAGAIGSRANGAGEFFPGQVADVLIYSDVTTAQRQRIQSYLAATYGLALNDVVAYSGDVGGLFWDTPIVSDGNVLIDPGSVSVTGTATVAAAGVAKVAGAAAVSSAFGVTAAGVVARASAGAAPVITATIVATGVNAAPGAATRPITATVGAAGNMAAAAGSGVSAAAVITAAGVIAGTSSAVISLATFTATGVGAVNALSGAAPSATATVSSAGRANLTGDSSVTAAATVTATGALSLRSGVAITAGFAVTAGPGAATRAGDVTVSAAAAVLAAGGSSVPSTVSATATITAAGSVAGSLSGATVSAAAAVTSSGAVAGARGAAVTALATVTTSGSTAASGITSPVAITAAITAVGSMGLRSPAAVTAAFGTVAVAAPADRATDAALTFGSQVIAGGTTAVPGALTVTFAVAAAGSVTGTHSAAQVTVTGAVLAAGAAATSGAAAITATAAVLAVGGVALTPTAAAVTAAATIASSGVVAATAAGAAVSVTAGVTAAGLVVRVSTASVTGVAATVAAGAILTSTAAGVTAAAAITSDGVIGRPEVVLVPTVFQVTASGSITAYATRGAVTAALTVTAAGRQGAAQDRALAIAAVIIAIGRVGRYQPHPITVGPPRDTFAGYLRSP